MNCNAFKRDLYHFQAEELSPAERAACLEHAGLCVPCAELLEVEQGFLRGLKARLVASPAPPGLETRVRERLREAGRASEQGFGWVRRPWFAALAASVLLAVLVLPALDPGPSPVTRIGPRIVTVVDFDCDRSGADFDQQRSCTHPRHFNALKLEQGGYWQIGADEELGRALMTDRDLRGSRMRVEGWLYERIQTLQLDRAVPAEVETARLVPGGH